MNDVIYVLSVTKKLLLVGVITNKRCLVIFGQNCYWIIIAKQPCKVLAKGIKDLTNGLYKLLTTKPQFVALMLKTITMEVDLWHRFHWHLHFSGSTNIVTTKKIKRHALISWLFFTHLKITLWKSNITNLYHKLFIIDQQRKWVDTLEFMWATPTFFAKLGSISL